MMIAVIGKRRVAAVFCCVLAVAGCSALTGRKESDRTGTPVPHASSAAPNLDAAFADPDVARDVMIAAKRDFETVSTYDYRDLSKYLSAGLQVTTTPYVSTYRAAFHGAAAAGLRAARVVQVATARVAAVAGISGDGNRATAIVLGGLTTSTASKPTAPTQTVKTVLHLERRGHVWRVSRLRTGAQAVGPIPANPDLQAAIASTRSTIRMLYGLRRKQFDADFQQVLRRTSGDLRTKLSDRRTTLRTRLTDAQYDLSSKIVGFAVAQAEGADATFVVAVDEYHLSRHGVRLGPTSHTLVVRATGKGGRWLLTSAVPVI